MLSARTALRRARRAARHAQWLAGHYAGLPLNIRRSAGLVTADAPPVAYLGFAGRGNAGDDAIMLAHIRSLPDIRLAPLPLEWERQTLDLMGQLRKRPLHAGILVGGGTLVGRRQWRERLEYALHAAAGPVAFTGVGVEEPAFEGTSRHTDEEELLRWGDLLSAAAHLTVRGPRSADLL